MNKKEIFIIFIVSIATFLLVYSPHFDYKYPLHIDEWYHISETLKISNGDYQIGYGTFRIGFDLFLLPLSYLFDLVKIYQFLPGLWAVLTGLTLFFIVYRKTEKNFFIALFSMIFFASLKSNVNIQGLWFFIPFVFCIPLIYLYVYFFSEGIEKGNKRYLIISMGLMLVTLFVHTSSFLFALPFILIYLCFNSRYLIREWKFFSLFLIIPFAGIIFYSFVYHIGFINSISRILAEIVFMRGHNPLELNNSFFEVYSLTGYLLALFGIHQVIARKKVKKFSIYLIWTGVTLLGVLIFKISGVSYLAPFQRMFYYFAISLPVFSALGVYYLIWSNGSFINNSYLYNKDKIKKFLSVLLIAIIILFTFFNYNDVHSKVKLYELIEEKDYSALMFLKNQSSGRVLSPLSIGSTSYAIAQQKTVGAIYFYGNRSVVERFFSAQNCSARNKILVGQNASYVITRNPIDCNWTLIYNNTDLIYTFRDTQKRKW